MEQDMERGRKLQYQPKKSGCFEGDDVGSHDETDDIRCGEGYPIPKCNTRYNELRLFHVAENSAEDHHTIHHMRAPNAEYHHHQERVQFNFTV